MIEYEREGKLKRELPTSMFTLVEAIARYCDGNDVVQALLQHSNLREKLLDSVIKIITEECLNVGRAASELTVF